MKRVALALALILAGGPALAAGPSFSCQHVTSADERAICRSPRLAAQDARTARLFGAVTGCLMMGSRDVEKTMQRRWLQQRAHCGGNRACLSRLYRARIAELAPRAAKARRLMAHGDCPGVV